MAFGKKKPGALVEMFSSLRGGKKSSPMDDSSDEGSPSLEVEVEDSEDSAGDGAYDAAFSSFADACGIPAENQGRAKAALKQFVSACMRGSSTEE